MGFKNDNFEVRRGDTYRVEVEVEDFDGTDTDLTGAQILLSYGKRVGGRPLVSRTEADLSVEGKVISCLMGTAETMSLEAYRTYYLRCRIVFPDGASGTRETVMTGTFTVQQTQD